MILSTDIKKIKLYFNRMVNPKFIFQEFNRMISVKYVINYKIALYNFLMCLFIKEQRISLAVNNF